MVLSIYIQYDYRWSTNTLTCGSYRGIELLEHVLERVIEGRSRKIVRIDSMQFGFMAGNSMTDAIFIVRQLQEKYLAKSKDLWMAFVDLEKAFDSVPWEVVWRVLRYLGVDEWIVSVIKTMYEDAPTKVRMNGRERVGLSMLKLGCTRTWFSAHYRAGGFAYRIQGRLTYGIALCG